MQLHLCLEALVLKPHLHFDFYLKTRIKITIKNKTIRHQYSAVQYSTIEYSTIQYIYEVEEFMSIDP